MSFDRVIDALTGDYVDDGNGSLRTTTTVATSLYSQFRITLNAWWGRSSAGNSIHELRQLGLVEEILVEARDRLLLALRPLIESGRAADPVIEIDEDRAGKLLLVSSIRDVQKGERITATIPIGV